MWLRVKAGRYQLHPTTQELHRFPSLSKGLHHTVHPVMRKSTTKKALVGQFEKKLKRILGLIKSLENRKI